jgi:cytochrome P450
VRRCLGAAFAEMEMRVVLGEILRRFDLRPASRKAERVARRNVTFSPRHGTRVIATRR